MERELSAVVASKIREFINIETRGHWTWRYTAILSDWVDKGLAELLRYILGRKEGQSVGEEALKTIALRALTDLRYHPKTSFFFFRLALAYFRIRELFDIIKEFPESMSAIEDLKMCITTPDQRDHLVTVFRQA